MSSVLTSSKSKIILAIDKNNLTEALDLCKEVKNHIGLFKLGMEFFYSCGIEGVNKIADLGIPIFLDIKLHDIPNTVAKSTLSLLTNLRNIKMLTLHASGGIKMMEDAQSVVKKLKKDTMLLGVTALTSMGESNPEGVKPVTFPFAMAAGRALIKISKLYKENKLNQVELAKQKLVLMIKNANINLLYWNNLYEAEKARIAETNKEFKTNPLIKDLNLEFKMDVTMQGFYEKNILSGGILNEVTHKAHLAFKSGIPGIVCSALEVEFIKEFFPTLIIVTPGIRPLWYNKQDDQTRIMTPKDAILAGSNYIVIGRPITEDRDPVQALTKTIQEISDV